MGIIRIDDELQEKVIKLLESEKRFDYPSVKAFVDKAIFEKLKKLEEEKNKR